MKYILIEHAEGNDPKRLRIFDTLAERAKATRECILGPPDEQNKDIPCDDLLVLATDGIVTFEGDPSLEWIDAEIPFETYGIRVPENLHPDTKNLVLVFAQALAEKLHAAEKKYGYSNRWLENDWEAECRGHLESHVLKGDPRDVAAYCAFAWWHKWSTNPHAPLLVVKG